LDYKEFGGKEKVERQIMADSMADSMKPSKPVTMAP
jgi:hypothetical protein